MLSRVSHMTILSVIMCVMNVKNQSSWTSLTSSCPFGVRSSKFVCRSKNVRSANSWTIWEQTFDNSPTVSNSSFLKLWSSKQSYNFVQLLSFCLPTRNSFQHIFAHVLPCRRTTTRDSEFPSMVIFDCSCMYIHQVAFPAVEQMLWILPMHPTILLHQRSSNLQYVLQH